MSKLLSLCGILGLLISSRLWGAGVEKLDSNDLVSGVYPVTSPAGKIVNNLNTDSIPVVPEGTTIAMSAVPIALVDVGEFRTVQNDNTVDFGGKFNMAVAALPPTGGTILIPPGEYTASTQPLITNVNYTKHISIMAYGATIRTSGAISALKIIGGPVSVYGIKIDQHGNAEANYGINIINGINVRLYDTMVYADGKVQAGYAAYRIANTTDNDPDTGSFWTRLYNPYASRSTGTGRMPVAILLEGAANATNIIGGNIGNAENGVFIRNQGAGTYTANGVLIDGCAFEQVTTAIKVSGVPSAILAGHRYTNNRFEAVSTAYSLTGITTQPPVPTYIAGNYYTADLGSYIHNPNNLKMSIFDLSINPVLTQYKDIYGELRITAQNSQHPLVIIPSGAASGWQMEDYKGNIVYGYYWNPNGDDPEEVKTGTGAWAKWMLYGVKGISSTGYNAENLRGTVTFVGSRTAAVSFKNNEVNTSYFVVLGCNTTAEKFGWSSKTVAGFSIHSDNVSSTATCDWVLIR